MTILAAPVESSIGLIMLMGIATKSSTLVVEYTVMARRAEGLTWRKALLDACQQHMRPIVITTIAMRAGMLPITFR